ncbi:MAG: hypothetical protein AB7O24_07415 [Kofleriaceae bacterium]
MGVELSYWTTAAIEPALRARIEREASELSANREWWCESLVFFEWPGKPGLAGSTKIFFGGGYSTESGDFVEVDPRDDMFLAARDASFIVAELARWSGLHGFSWELVCGEPIGRIVAGSVELRVEEFLAALADEGQATGPAADEQRATSLLATHIARK